MDSVSRSQEGETLASLEESCSQAVAELRDHFVQEAIRLVEEREAAEAAEFEERRNQRALERRLRKTAREGEKEANQTEEPDEGEQEEEDPQDSERTADEEEEKDTPSLQRLPRELVEEAASGEASLRAFNETVLTPFKTHIASLGENTLSLLTAAVWPKETTGRRGLEHKDLRSSSPSPQKPISWQSTKASSPSWRLQPC